MIDWMELLRLGKMGLRVVWRVVKCVSVGFRSSMISCLDGRGVVRDERSGDGCQAG